MQIRSLQTRGLQDCTRRQPLGFRTTSQIRQNQEEILEMWR